MPLVYKIPGVKKQTDQGSSVQDTIPTPRIDNSIVRNQWYDLSANALRYQTRAKIDIHSSAPSLDLFIPKRQPFVQNLNYRTVSGSKYIDSVAVVTNDHFAGIRPFPQPPVNYRIPLSSKYIETVTITPTHEGIVVRKNPTYPLVYPRTQATKLIDVTAVVSQDVFVRRNNPYPQIAFYAPKPNKYIDIPAYVPEQGYIFPVQKPVQEWYKQRDFPRHIKKVIEQFDTPVVVTSGNALLACVNTTISWQDHFISNAWATPQAQITAGYAIYVEPSLTTGSYVEVFDFGSIISNIIAVVNWNQTTVVGTVTTVSTTLETSTDGITWSAPTVGTSVFSASLRYVRLTMNFVGASDKSLAIYNNLQCLLNVHREQDGGQANVFAADVGGTVVSFNKAFKALDALTVTPISTVEQKAVYDFAFPVNPTTFKVLLFNAAGVRIDGLITWVARGIF